MLNIRALPQVSDTCLTPNGESLVSGVRHVSDTYQGVFELFDFDQDIARCDAVAFADVDHFYGAGDIGIDF